MKYNSFVLFFILSFLTVSCNDNLVDVGTGIQPTSDGITVGVDTFHVATANVSIDAMTVKPDSFLLGSLYNEKYGSTQADILAQLEGPIGFKYPAKSVFDSTLLMLRCKSSYGDRNAPLDVNVYMMNKTFNFTSNYSTALNPADYVDFSNVALGHNVVTARYSSGSVDSTIKVIKLSDSFTQKLCDQTTYTDESTFYKSVGGVYLKVNFGMSALLNIRQIDLQAFYHYPVVRNGKDTIASAVLTFPANVSVRQVNRILHPDKAALWAKLEQQKDTVNYVSAPANVQTQITLPLARMKQQMDAKMVNKKLLLNSALINVEVFETDSSTYPLPVISHMLLIKESEIADFFKNDKLPTGSNAALGAYATSTSTTNSITTTSRYYSFNIAKLLATEIKAAEANNTLLTDDFKNFKMRLVPVNVTYNSSQIITAAKQQSTLGAITICGGKKKVSPMKVQMVYSGF
jgi:hypothetical protein